MLLDVSISKKKKKKIRIKRYCKDLFFIRFGGYLTQYTHNSLCVCKKHYIDSLANEFAIANSFSNPPYTPKTHDKEEFLNNHK